MRQISHFILGNLGLGPFEKLEHLLNKCGRPSLVRALFVNQML